jgi:hypothetical protein
MAETIKVLGQSAPSATTLTDLYTVPASTSTTISTFIICNRGSSNATFRVSVAVGGASDDNKQYLYYDALILKNDSIPVTIGPTLAATDVVRVYASSADLSFNIFGVEIS